MPELAASFFVGFIVSLIANLAHFIFVMNSFKDSKVTSLQGNLQKIGRIWSMSQRSVVAVSTSGTDSLSKAISEDFMKTLRSTGLFSVMLTVASWFGVIALSLYLFSVHRWAKSRMEHKIFASKLGADTQLSADEVLKIFSEIESYQ